MFPAFIDEASDYAFIDCHDELSLWSSYFCSVLLNFVPIKSNQLVLDVACGTGSLAVELAQRCGRGSTVTAVDISAPAIRRLHRKISRLGIKNVVPINEDASCLLCADNTYDVVTSNLGLNNFENRRAVLESCFRVLRPDGSFILTTNPVGHMAEFFCSFRLALEAVGDLGGLRRLEEHISHRLSEEALGSLLAETGFSVLHVYREAFSMRFADAESFLHHHLIRSGFLRAWYSVISPDRGEDCLRLLTKFLDADSSAAGWIEVTVPVLCVVASK